MVENGLLRGQQVYLNQVQREDLPQSAAWFHDDIALRRLLDHSVVYPTSLPDEENWFEKIVQGNDKVYVFAIRTLDGDHLLGDCDIFSLNWQARSCMVGISISHPDYRGKGYGSDAMRLLLHYGFMELNMNRIALETYSYNERAIGSYLKVGFREEGRLREFVQRDGQHYDSVCMSILRPEWEALAVK